MLVLLATACSREVLDFEATCGAVWPEDTCAESCGGTEVERRWARAFDRAFALETGLDEADVSDFARVRSIRGGPDTRSITSASYQVDVDWVRIVREVELWTDDDTDDGLVAAWRERMAAPSIELDQRLASYRSVESFVADCESRKDVVLDAEGWCDPYVTRDPNDDDPQVVRFDFVSETQGYTYTMASIDVTEHEPWTCETNTMTVDR